MKRFLFLLLFLFASSAYSQTILVSGANHNTPQTKQYTDSVVLTEAINTTSDVNLIRIKNIAANDFADGDVFQIEWFDTSIVASGTTAQWYFSWNGNKVTCSNAGSLVTSATTGRTARLWYVRRIGTSLYINSSAPSANNMTTDSYAANPNFPSADASMTGQSFNVTCDMDIGITFGFASNGCEMNPLWARVTKISKH